MVLAYFDTQSGIAGDMLLSALVDAGADSHHILRRVQSLGLESVALDFTETVRHCFRALHLEVKHPPEHAHRHLSDIEAMIRSSQLDAREQDLALRMFKRIGVAEAKVHGTSLEKVHFHEVGAVDSIVDIVGIAVALNFLEVERIVAAPPPLGCGEIEIAHGRVSVPAPATAELLVGIPIRTSSISAELTTPTGATVLASLVDEFGSIPNMQITRIGYGAGSCDFSEQANILRVFIGTPLGQSERETLVQLECNIDDITGEQLGYALEQLWQLKPLDVYTTPIVMKKGRPAVLLSVLCRPENVRQLEDCIFRHSGSLGVRQHPVSRTRLHRELRPVTTSLGEIHVKIAWSTDGEVQNVAPEYEDCKRVADKHGIPIREVFQLALQSAPTVSAPQLPHSLRNVEVSPSSPAGHHHDHHDHHHH